VGGLLGRARRDDRERGALDDDTRRAPRRHHLPDGPLSHGPVRGIPRRRGYFLDRVFYS
jgi:hypothetical protein